MRNNITKSILVKLQNIPLSIILLATILSCYGFTILYSASGGSLSPWADKQIVTFLGFTFIALIIALIDIKLIYKFTYPFFIFNIALLLIVNKFGYSAMGATRWVSFFGFRLQPSELTKISLILFLARYFHDLKVKEHVSFSQIILPFVICLIPIALIIKQPDLGTGLICLGIVVAIVFVVGLEIKYFISSVILAILAVPIIWLKLHEYQRKRILIFLNPEEDLLGAGYNIHQSKIAIGSGGVLGKGFLNGTQSHLHFLPEFQTDFAFALLCEEFGLIGALILIVLYFLLVVRYILVSINSNSIFGKLLVLGIASMVFLHCFINIGMVMGILPVVGVPLPFISYGGTMVAVMLISLGLVLNTEVNSHKKLN